MIISIEAEETFDKIQCTYVIKKTLSKLGIEGIFSNLIKDSKVQLNDKIEAKPENESINIERSEKSKTFIIKKQSNKDS